MYSVFATSRGDHVAAITDVISDQANQQARCKGHLLPKRLPYAFVWLVVCAVQQQEYIVHSTLVVPMFLKHQS